MRSLDLPALLIEAFALEPCQGNGAAVVWLDRPLSDAAMQAIAGSLRQSETAFLLRARGHWLLRWFTPSCEVPLCGHATLAALLALQHWGQATAGDHLLFHTRSGPLPAHLDPARAGCGTIGLPSSTLQAATPEPALAQRLARRCGASIERYWTSALGYHVALLAPGTPLAGLNGLGDQLEGPARRGLVVMAAVDPCDDHAPCLQGRRADYQLRFFAPGLGIPEDPVTGSAHALVAPHWIAELGQAEVVGWQPSTRPGGMVCRAASSGMIHLLGTGHLLWDGTLHFGPCGSGHGSASASGAPQPPDAESPDPVGSETDGWAVLPPRD